MWRGNKKLYKYGGGNRNLNVLTGVTRLFQSGSSSKQEICCARWRGVEEYFTECQQKPKWRVESYHCPALLCICKVSLQSHCCMLWRGSEHAAEEVNKKVDAPQG